MSQNVENYIIDTAQNRNIVSKILNIDPNTSDWKIIDSDNIPTKSQMTEFARLHENDPATPEEEKVFFDPEETDLVLVHYNEGRGFNPSEYAQLRGTVVSLKQQCVVAGTDNHGYTPTTVAEKIDFSNKERDILKDQDGGVHTFDPTAASYSRLYDGTFCRAFCWNGKIYLSIHRKIDVEKVGSTWCNGTAKFIDMFTQMGGDLDALFPNRKTRGYSPYCYYFILHHPDVVVANKIDLSKGGVLIYLGCEQMWKPDDISVPLDNVDCEIHEPAYTTEFNGDKQPFIYKSNELTLEEVNNHLRFGFYEHDGLFDRFDNRLGTGEAVVARILNQETGKNEVIRIHSPAYQWRLNMRANDQNLYCRFVRNCTDALMDWRDEECKNEYMSKYPILSYISEANLKDQVRGNYVILMWPQQHRIDNLDRYYGFGNSYRDKLNAINAKMQNIYRCTIISCPPHLQKEAVHFLEKFKTDKRDLVDWLYKIYCGEIQREDPRITERGWARKRMDAIIGAASKGAKEDVKKNIINLVHKEGFRIKYEGSMEIKIKQENSLYQLISAMKRYYRLCENSQ